MYFSVSREGFEILPDLWGVKSEPSFQEHLEKRRHLEAEIKQYLK